MIRSLLRVCGDCCSPIRCRHRMSTESGEDVSDALRDAYAAQERAALLIAAALDAQ